MEKIGLHNYEAFFLDYLEGSLSAQQEFELLDFLDKHPDLKAELDMDLSEISLHAEEVSIDKSSMKKEGIQPEEVDDLMIASVEGVLGLQDQAELSSYVNNYGLQNDLKLYQNTILIPNMSEGFGNKRKLKKGNRFAPIFYPVFAVAAVTLALIGINNMDQGNDTITNSSMVPVQEASIQFEPKISTHELNARFVSIDDISEMHHAEIHESVDQVSSQAQVVLEEDISDELQTVDQPSVDPSNILNNDGQEDVNKKDEKEDEILKPNKPQEIILDKKTRDQQKKKKDAGGIVTEEPIKVITNLAGNFFNKDISYKRDRNTKSDQLVSHHVKLGKFEFERKKH